jgi:hypothetical protein
MVMPLIVTPLQVSMSFALVFAPTFEPEVRVAHCGGKGGRTNREPSVVLVGGRACRSG